MENLPDQLKQNPVSQENENSPDANDSMSADSAESAEQTTRPSPSKEPRRRLSSENQDELPPDDTRVYWQVTFWLLVLIGAVSGFVYFYDKPDYYQYGSVADPAESSGSLNDWQSAIILYKEFAHVTWTTIWSLVPNSVQDYLAQHRFGILAGAALFAVLALLQSIFLHLRRRTDFYRNKSRLAEGALNQLVVESVDTTKQVMLLARVISQMGKLAVTSTDQSQSSLELINQATKKGSAAARDVLVNINNSHHQLIDSTALVKRLGENAKRIHEAVNLLQDRIAQAKILSLNASIQASVTGTAGREFITAAEQAQQLTDASAQRANEILELVQGIQDHVSHAEHSLQTTTKQMTDSVALGNTSNKALDEIGSICRYSLESLGEAINMSQTTHSAVEHEVEGANTQSQSQSQSKTPQSNSSMQIAKIALTVARLKNATVQLKRAVTALRNPVKNKTP